MVATDARLTREQANRLATVCHDGFARTIWPAHCRSDGDVIFTIATGAVEIDRYAYSALEALATRAVERAVLNGVHAADGLHGVPSAAEWAREGSLRARNSGPSGTSEACGNRAPERPRSALRAASAGAAGAGTMIGVARVPILCARSCQRPMRTRLYPAGIRDGVNT